MTKLTGNTRYAMPSQSSLSPPVVAGYSVVGYIRALLYELP